MPMLQSLCNGFRDAALSVPVAAALSFAAPASADDGPLSQPAPSDPDLSNPTLSNDDYAFLRSEMVESMRYQTLALAPELGGIRLSDAILDAFQVVPRHEFVPEDIRIYSYIDAPLPVAEGATVSQPFITAYMIELLEVGPEDDVLQAAVGGGYETAILLELAGSVSGMEFHAPVAETAAETLAGLGYSADIRQGDIYYGWPENRRFDAILVRMAMPYVPSPLVDQLQPGGRLVAPIGPDDGPQAVMLVTKDTDGTIRRERGLAVRFQPLPGGTRL